MSSQPLYSIGTYDMELQEFTPHHGMRCDNLTLWQLKDAMQELKRQGYECHRSGGCSDPSVWVERQQPAAPDAATNGE
jgi:hypothetical protein